MADCFSAVANVLTVVTALSQAIKYAKALYRASAEFEALQVRPITGYCI